MEAHMMDPLMMTTEQIQDWEEMRAESHRIRTEEEVAEREAEREALIERNRNLFQQSYHDIMDSSRRRPSVLETILYMQVIQGEGVEDIAGLIRELNITRGERQ